MPVVLRISIGAKYGAQHSQDWTALLTHIPGLKVVYPVTPYDAKGMMNTALAGTDPWCSWKARRSNDFGEMFVSRAFRKATTKSTWPSHRSNEPAAT